MRPSSSPQVVMASLPSLQQYLRNRLQCEFDQGAVDLKMVRCLVSSPNLASMSVKAFHHSSLCIAGETYLDAHTMLADRYQKTYALSLGAWSELARLVETVNEYHFTDASVMKLQVWPFDPRALDDFQMAIAVALSFTPAELMADSRISLAIDEIFQQWGYFADEF